MKALDQQKGDLIQLLPHAKEEQIEEVKPNFIQWCNGNCDLEPSKLVVCYHAVMNLRFTGTETESLHDCMVTESLSQ